MKVTKRQLRRIIKEEKRKLLNEYDDRGNAKVVAHHVHQRLDEIMAEVLDGLPVEELEWLSTMQVTGPGGWDEATQALAKIALSQLDDGGHYRGG